MTDRYTRTLSRLLIALPLLSLALGALAWLRYGMDMPWYDDWRGYAEGNIGSFSPAYLFRAINDTLAPVGFALDALAEHFLNGNSVAYQFLSMTIVLGSLLLLQWKLLRKALGSQLQAAACFSLTVLMLQPDSYWGRENLAYHQCLPLVFILGAMWLIVCSEAARGWRLAVIPVLGLVAGFTYISGAFGVFTAGVSLLLIAATCHTGASRKQIFRGAGLLTAAGAIAVAAQAFFSLLKFSSSGTHAGIPMALPNQAAFWMFYLGKMGRSLMLPASEINFSIVVTLLACVTAIGVAVALFRQAAGSEATPEDKRLAAIYLTLLAVVFVYMMMVAAGRTNYRDPQITHLRDIFAVGFTRFHFFWATLLWPWVAAGVIYLVRQSRWGGALSFRWLGIGVILVLAGLLAARGGYDHMRFHRELAASRLPVAQCLLEGLQSGGEIKCAGLLPPRFLDAAPDAYPAYVNARKMGASFVRYFPILPKLMRRFDIPAFYDMAAKGEVPGLSQLVPIGKDAYKVTGGDPQMQIQTGQPLTMQRCTTIDVDVVMKVDIADIAQVYFQPVDTTEYSEKYSYRVSVPAAEAFQTRTFRLESPVGFRDTLRFDPATQPQKLVVKDLRVYCVRPQP